MFSPGFCYSSIVSTLIPTYLIYGKPHSLPFFSFSNIFGTSVSTSNIYGTTIICPEARHRQQPGSNPNSQLYDISVWFFILKSSTSSILVFLNCSCSPQELFSYMLIFAPTSHIYWYLINLGKSCVWKICLWGKSLCGKSFVEKSVRKNFPLRLSGKSYWVVKAVQKEMWTRIDCAENTLTELMRGLL